MSGDPFARPDPWEWGIGDLASDVRHFGADRAGHHRASASGCGCGGNDSCKPSVPDPPADGGGWHDDAGTPAKVLLGRIMPQRDSDPLTAREAARDEVAARYAEPEMRGGDLEAVLARRSFDGGNLSGSAALDWLRKHPPVNRLGSV